MRRGRPREPKPVLRGRIYWARVTFDLDGVSVRRWVNLKTPDLDVAKVKLAQVVKNATSPDRAAEAVENGETFEEAARRIVGASSIASKERREGRLKAHVFPAIGSKPVKDIRAGDVRAILETLAVGGSSKQTCLHVRNDISAVLGELWRSEILPENVVSRVRLPKFAKVDTRERAVLTDEELVRYLAWSHPEQERQASVLERQTMACVSRCFGGLRWGDIRALLWGSFDTTDGKFERGWAPRKKTARPQLLGVPEILRPILRDWWERAGRPTEGPMFPVRKGDSAGSERKPSSIAKALRRDLRRAFGIDAPRPSQRVRKNGRPDSRLEWYETRPPTERERELLTEGRFTRPVDFHSFRRQFKQALADAGVDVQQTMALSGATDLAAHRRYLTNTAKLRVVPAAALPSFGASVAETLLPCIVPGLPANSFAGVYLSGTRGSNARPRAWESENPAETRDIRRYHLDADAANPQVPADLLRNPGPQFAWARRAADRALAAYLGEVAVHLAASV
jgi:integrase